MAALEAKAAARQPFTIESVAGEYASEALKTYALVPSAVFR